MATHQTTRTTPSYEGLAEGEANSGPVPPVAASMAATESGRLPARTTATSAPTATIPATPPATRMKVSSVVTFLTQALCFPSELRLYAPLIAFWLV